jgi:hypothetical protein
LGLFEFDGDRISRRTALIFWVVFLGIIVWMITGMNITTYYFGNFVIAGLPLGVFQYAFFYAVEFILWTWYVIASTKPKIATPTSTADTATLSKENK